MTKTTTGHSDLCPCTHCGEIPTDMRKCLLCSERGGLIIVHGDDASLALCPDHAALFGAEVEARA